MKTESICTVRQATPADATALKRLIQRESRVTLRFAADALTDHLIQQPFLVAEQAGRLRGFLAFFMPHPPKAALAAAGLADDWTVAPWLDVLLPPCTAHLQAQGATALSYIGPAAWLVKSLQARGFYLVSHIVAYEKLGTAIPDLGNRTVQVRPVRPADLVALVALDALTFHPLWQNSVETLQRWQAALPYFVVAVAGQEPIGYCYCSVEVAGYGHLIRIAVHPAWQRRGVGSRLLAEALQFFRRAGATSVTLNTQQQNEKAQGLYQKFGFEPIEREATALWMDL